MEKILLIEPNEWEKVAEVHLVEFPGWYVDSLRRKYTSIHRKKVPTRNLKMPNEVRLAKKVKYSAAWGEEEYDMISDFFDGGDKDDITPPPRH